jgi:hypothetical protein
MKRRRLEGMRSPASEAAAAAEVEEGCFGSLSAAASFTAMKEGAATPIGTCKHEQSVNCVHA